MEDKQVIVIPILCDCCGHEKMAEIKGGKLIIYDKRHGQRHFVVLDIEKLANIVLTPLTKVV